MPRRQAIRHAWSGDGVTNRRPYPIRRTTCSIVKWKSPLTFHRGQPTIANGPKRVNRIVLECFYKLSFLLRELKNLKNTLASRDEIETKRAEFMIAEWFV